MTQTSTQDDAKTRLAEKNLSLPVLGPPAYSYDAWTEHDGTAYFSGQISRTEDGRVLSGRAGESATLADASAAAETAALNLLARIDEAVGLENVQKILKLNVWISSAPDFTDQPTAAESASKLLLHVLGDAGRHARTTLPTHVLPKDALVELEAVVAVSRRA